MTVKRRGPTLGALLAICGFAACARVGFSSRGDGPIAPGDLPGSTGESSGSPHDTGPPDTGGKLVVDERSDRCPATAVVDLAVMAGSNPVVQFRVDTSSATLDYKPPCVFGTTAGDEVDVVFRLENAPVGQHIRLTCSGGGRILWSVGSLGGSCAQFVSGSVPSGCTILSCVPNSAFTFNVSASSIPAYVLRSASSGPAELTLTAVP